jgi:hypothetical protein
MSDDIDKKLEKYKVTFSNALANKQVLADISKDIQKELNSTNKNQPPISSKIPPKKA